MSAQQIVAGVDIGGTKCGVCLGMLGDATIELIGIARF